MPRLLTLALTVLLALGTAVLPGAPAGAGALPSRTVTAVGHEHDPPFITGRVSPDFGGKKAVVQRKKCRAGCTWKTYAKVATNPKGYYRANVQWPKAGKKLYYRVKANQCGGYATSYSMVLVAQL